MSKKISGVNFIGHIHDSSGLGNTARLFMRSLIANGINVAALDIDQHALSTNTKIKDVTYCANTKDLPYDTNIIVVSIHLLSSMWRNRLRSIVGNRFVNVGLFFWEIQTIPSAWVPAVELFDAVMVCSNFVRSAVELDLPQLPTVYAEHPLEVNIENYANEKTYHEVRAELNVNINEVLFAASFDIRSNFQRKNPIAVLTAFENAFKEEPRARLLLKANGLQNHNNESIQTILEKINRNKKIILIEKTLSYPEVMRLYSACDVFVSLHRSEGLGLGPLEAMLMGKAVMATGYSGNMTYMTEQNSIPIPYTLVEPDNAGWMFSKEFCGSSGYWAEPDVDFAAKTMQFLFNNKEYRTEIGSAAQADIKRRQNTAWKAVFLQNLENLKLKPKSLDNGKRQLQKITINEILNPVLRRKNITALKNHLIKKIK